MSETYNLEKDYELLAKTVEYLKTKSIMFRNTMPKLMKLNFNFKLSEEICTIGLKLSNNNWEMYCSNLDNLIEMSKEFLKLQKNLEQNGKYLFSTFEEVEKNEYNLDNDELNGPDYLWGLYFSEIFWKIHHNFTNFCLNHFMTNVPSTGKILEVPTGTGFFLCEFLKRNSTWSGVGVDLADSSMKFSKSLFEVNNVPKNSYQLLKMNFHDIDSTVKYDRILCGEFLEHLEDPLQALKKLKSLLTKDGKIFVTAAVWAAHIDHIFLYKSAEEVREHIKEAGLSIENELVQAVFEKDESDPEKEKIPVSYAAILS